MKLEDQTQTTSDLLSEDGLAATERVPCYFLLTDMNFLREMLQNESAFLDLTAPINVCGDIHGQFIDLLRIFQLCGKPPTVRYLFLGDYVDRGPYSLETICILMLLKIRYPAKIYLLRGNHECSQVNSVYGFREEIEERFEEGIILWLEFQEMFNWLPLTGRIGKRILCMHGGLSPKMNDITALKRIKRPSEPLKESLELDILWSDPDPSMPSGPEDPKFKPSQRGVSFHFTERVVKETCSSLKVDLIVRAHQVVQVCKDGYEFFANRHMVTVFSAPNYCGVFNNSGAILTIDQFYRCAFITLKPVDLPIKVSGRSKTEIDLDDELEAALESQLI